MKQFFGLKDSINLVRLSEEHTVAFKEEMQEAFQHGFEAYNKDAEETNQWQVLPDKDFYQSLNAEGAEAYEAVNEDGQRVGGAIITVNGNMGELAFLYVKVGVQSKGIGQSIWRAIETMHRRLRCGKPALRISTAAISTSTSTAAVSMPLSSSTSITLTPICQSSLTRRTDFLSLKRE